MVRGRTEAAVEYAEAMFLLGSDPAYVPFEGGWGISLAAEAYGFLTPHEQEYRARRKPGIESGEPAMDER